MKKKLIISCYDSPYHPNYQGGGAMVVKEMLSRLSCQYEIQVFYGTFPGSNLITTSPYPVKFIGASFLGPRLGQILFTLATYIKSRTQTYDVWIECSTPPFTFSLLPLFAHHPVISWVHMFAAIDMQRKYRLPFPWIEKLLSRNYSHFIVLSPWMKDKLLSEYGVHATVNIVPNGVYSVKFARSTKGQFFLFLGRLEINQKGLDLLLSAFKLAFPGPIPTLVLAGNGSPSELKTLKQQIHQLGLTHQVSIVGRVTGHTKQSLLSRCVALVLPSRYDTNPLVVLEAFASSKPVVCFNLPSLSWIPISTSLKVPAFNISAYAIALQKLYSDSRLRHTLGKAGLSYSRSHSWESVFRQFNSVINTI